MIRRSFQPVLALVVVLVSPGHAHGQAVSGLAIQSGTEVRVVRRAAPDERVQGTVAALARDTLTIRVSDAMQRFAIADLAALEVRGGEDKRRGFFIGAGIATGITAVAGGIDLAKGGISGGDLLGTLIANALIGGLVGYAFAPSGWQRLPLPEPAAVR